MTENWIDIAILTIFTLSIILGMWRGLFGTLFGILSIVAGIYAATLFSEQLTVALHPIVGNSPGVPLLAKVILFMLGFLVFGTVGLVMRNVLRKIDVGNVDTFGGAVLGFLRAALFSAFLVLILSTVMSKTNTWKESFTVPHIGTMIKIAMLIPPLNNYQPLLTYDKQHRPAIKTDEMTKSQWNNDRREIAEESRDLIQHRDNLLDDVTTKLIEQTVPEQRQEEMTKEAIKAFEERKKLSPSQKTFNWLDKLLCDMQEKKNCDGE